ncbi:MAG: class I SAM-dependent methyltransferase [Candidatus Aenigmarchaeota archaeon]|nr:class I SAM-dependent methyltransferase [Candidatus Aenigmarchaeota archaeon]
MTTISSARVVRDLAKNRNLILDAGCGSGVLALHLAKQNPYSTVHGYDISPDQIAKAEGYKKGHGIGNASFSVSGHDDFQPPYAMDMVCTIGSLVDESEIPYYEAHDQLGPAKDIVRRRLSRFSHMLNSSGIYVFSWASLPEDTETFVELAGNCGLNFKEEFHMDIPSELKTYYHPEAMKFVLVFQRS